MDVSRLRTLREPARRQTMAAVAEALSLTPSAAPLRPAVSRPIATVLRQGECEHPAVQVVLAQMAQTVADRVAAAG